MSDTAKDVIFVALVAIGIMIVGIRIGVLIEQGNTDDCPTYEVLSER